MPGIFGFFKKNDFDLEQNAILIKAMESSLSHNHNYTSVVFSNEWCGIGNIEIPWHDENKFHVDSGAGKVAAFSGYIYDWEGLDRGFSPGASRKAPTIIELWDRYDDKLPLKVHGSFNGIVIDLNKRRFLLFNDRLGHRQLYYYEDEHIFMFSTEYKAFFNFSKFNKFIDLDGVGDYFNFGYVLGDKTFLRNVRFLSGASIIEMHDNKAGIRKYWEFDFNSTDGASLPDLIEEADSIYREIIAKRLDSAENVILPLSGGLDSRFLLAHTIATGKTPSTFTHGRKNCLDSRIASKVARVLGVDDHEFIEINPLWMIEYIEKFVFLTEGMVDSSPSILLGISEHYQFDPARTVFLNGIFGGPTNFGSPYYKESDLHNLQNHEDLVNDLSNYFSLESLDYRLLTRDFAESLRSKFKASLDRELSSLSDISEFYNQKDLFFINNRLVRYMNQVDVNRYLWHDHFALYDHKLIDFYMKLPPKFKLNRRFFIEYFKSKFPRLAAIQYQASGVNLYQTPSKFKKMMKENRNKLGYYLERLSKGKLRYYNPDNYIHHNQWYRADSAISDYFNDLLMDSKTLDRGFYDKSNIRALLKRQNSGGDSFYAISSLASFELFNRLFIDK